MAFGSLGSIWAEIGLETTKLQKGVATATMQLSTLDRQAMTQAASINAKLQTIGTGLQSVGKKMSMYVTLPLMAVGAASIKAGADFDSGMTKSLAIMTNITPQIRAEMEKTAKSIVDYTTFSAKEGADAYFYLASAGLDAAQSIEALPRVAKFAQAGQFDLALATDLLTDAQSALGLTIRDDVTKNMENMVRVSDVLVKANTLSNATVQQFSESLTNKAGAALKLLNKDIEEGVAVLAAWADQGVKGSEAGNWLNIVLRDLQRSAIENGEAFEKFNINVFDTSGNVRNIADVIGDLETALEGMSDKEKRATLMMLGFQDRSISAMMTLLGTSDAIRGYEEDLRSATGFTEDVAAKQMESFTASVEQLKNQLINVGISLFDILKPRLESVVEIVKKGIDWFNNLSDSQKKWLVNIGLITAAVGPVLLGLGSMIRAVTTLRTAFVSLSIATKGVLTAGSVSWITATIAASVLLNKYLVDTTDNLREQETWWAAVGKQLIDNIFLITGIINKYKDIKLLIRAKNELTKEEIKTIREQSDSFGEVLKNVEDVLEAKDAEAKATEELTQKYKDADEAIEALTKENIGLGYEEKKAAARAEEMADELGYTTEAVEDQEKSIEDLREELGRLIDEIFGVENAEIRLRDINWELEDLFKDLTDAVSKYGEGSREVQEIEDNIYLANQEKLALLFELYNQEGLDLERKRELRQELIDLARQTQETSGLSQEEFIAMANQFSLSSDEILSMLEELGYELTELEKERVITVKAETAHATSHLQSLKNLLDQIQSKSITIDTSYAYSTVRPYSAGGIVSYSHGGIVGNDGAKIPPLTAASGMVVPQTGRKVPIVAHENEVVLNTSQQKNIAEWIMGKATSRPDNMRNVPIEIRIPIELDGRIIGENVSKFIYDGSQIREKLGA